MSEGQIFRSVVPGLTLYLPGVKPVKFKNGRYPMRKDKTCTDPQVIAAIKAHGSYGGMVLSEEDKIIRDTPSPKVVEDLMDRALEALKEIPGVTPSALIPSQPLKEELIKSPEPELAQQAQAPSLTDVSRMRKDDLMNVADELGIDVHDGDTVAILKRRVRNFIKKTT